MKKNAFTLIELLATITILGIITGIVTITISKITKSYALTYYKSIELSALSAGSEYFTYNTKNLNYEIGSINKISLEYLIQNKYLDNIKSCDLKNSYVYYQVATNQQKQYQVCLKCSDYLSTTCNTN